MLQKILHSDYIKGNKVYGVHINHEPDGINIFRAVLLNKKKGNVEFEQKDLIFDSFDEFLEKCDKSIPLILSFDSKQVLSKKVIIDNDKKNIEYLLPNASENDFYTQEWILTDTEKYVAAIRRDVIDPVIQSFNDKGYSILRLFLGAFALKNIIGIEEDFKLHFTAGNYSINIIEDIPLVKKLKESTLETYAIGSDFITSEFLIAFASGIDFFVSEFNQDESTHGINSENFLYKQLFVKSSWAVLIFVFAVLLINYLFYMQYEEQRNDLNAQYSQNIGLISKLENLRTEVSFKESFLGDKGFLKKSITSFYSDKIAASVPKDIALTDLTIYPLQKQIKINEAINFDIGQILIRGTYLRSTVLNNWIVRLENFDWVENVEIKGLFQEKTNDPGEFELMLSIK